MTWGNLCHSTPKIPSKYFLLTLAPQGIPCTGFVCGNGPPGFNLMCDVELKRAGRGSLEQKRAMIGQTTLHIVKWYNNS